MLTSRTLVALLFSCFFAASFGHPQLQFESEQRLQKHKIDEDKTWLFAVDGIKYPYSFVNEVGVLGGFDVDVISAVCGIAQKKCSMVLTEFTECVFTFRNTINFPGRGLMAGWFDACPGFEITEDRKSTFDFTSPYLSTVATFTVAPGNPFDFNPDEEDLSKYTLTHLTGAPTGASCLTRLQKRFGNIIIARDLPEAKALLLNRTAQALFSPRTHIDGLEVLPKELHCSPVGAGVMLKKGSTLPSWWNPAFKTFYDSGEYHRLCIQDSLKYSFAIRCLNNPRPVPPSSEDVN